MSSDPQFPWWIIASYLAAVASTATCAALAPVARKIVRWLTSKLEKSVDADRVREELDGMVLDLPPVERAQFTIELLVAGSRLADEIKERAVERSALIERITSETEAIAAFVANIPYYIEGRSKIEAFVRSFPSLMRERFPASTLEELRTVLTQFQNASAGFADKDTPLAQSSARCFEISLAASRMADAISGLQVDAEFKAKLSARLRGIPATMAEEPAGTRRAVNELRSVLNVLHGRRAIAGYKAFSAETEAQLDSLLVDAISSFRVLQDDPNFGVVQRVPTGLNRA